MICNKKGIGWLLLMRMTKQHKEQAKRNRKQKLPGVNISREGGSDNVSQVRHVVDIGQGRGDQHIALAGDRHPGKNSKRKRAQAC